jgi:hypothetical protein
MDLARDREEEIKFVAREIENDSWITMVRWDKKIRKKKTHNLPSRVRLKTQFSFRVRFRRRDQETIRRIESFFGGVVSVQMKDENNPDDVWYWLNLQGSAAYEVMETCSPYLVKKLPQWEIYQLMKQSLDWNKMENAGLRLSDDVIAYRDSLIERLRDVEKLEFDERQLL